MSEHIIEQLHKDIDNAKSQLAIGDSLANLRENKDFKKVILEGYFEKEAVRLVMLKADPQMQKPEYQASIIKQIDAIGALNDYFNTVFFNHNKALSSIRTAEEEIASILNDEE